MDTDTGEIQDICTALGRLAHLYGVEYSSTIDMKVGMLKAMKVLDDDFNYETQSVQQQSDNLNLINKKIKRKYDNDFSRIVHHSPVIRKNRNQTIEISLPEWVQTLKWDFFEDEDPKKYYKGEVNIDDTEKMYSGEVSVRDLVPVTDEQNRTVERKIGDTVYRKYQFKLPFDVNLGYHDLSFSYKDKIGRDVVQKTHLISAPEKCYDGLGVSEGKKTWGVPVQLYEQNGQNNIGIGNYSDLAQIGYILGKNGAGLLGVNPLHASRCDHPENASPYSPDSRMFFNYIYLDVTAIPEFKNSPEIQAYFDSSDFQYKVKRNRRKSHVDYTVTQELVDDILHKCYEKFKNNEEENREEHNLYNVFCDSQDGILDMYATFRAMSAYFAKQKPQPLDWTCWPDDYKNPNSHVFKRFVEEHADEIGFYKYAQWQCNKQLAEVKDVCLNAGMKIGLYMDMAVGASPKGFEAWYYNGLFIDGSAGAMADELSPTGQKWNVLGFNPLKLQELGYEPYRRILETNMKYAGCIRIDHVLQLNRLYFHPNNKHQGTYVYYNAEELMAIIALESHRHKTMIIGEDLGCSTEEFRRKMEDYGILSYKVLPFERGCDGMCRPENYMPLSVCATSTHDTPTLLNQWNVLDVWQKKKLGFYNENIINKMFEQYASQREELNWVLNEYGCWDEVGGKPSDNPRENANFVPDKYVEAVVSYMAKSKSAIMMLPFSDIFRVNEMGNIPGTLDVDMSHSPNKSIMEISGNDGRFYPNWRKKLHIRVEHIEEMQEFKDAVEILNKYRSDGGDSRGKYYQFVRPGRNDPSPYDFDKARRIFNILCSKEEYNMSNYIEFRYSPVAKRMLDSRKASTLKYAKQAKNNWDRRNSWNFDNDGRN